MGSRYIMALVVAHRIEGRGGVDRIWLASYQLLSIDHKGNFPLRLALRGKDTSAPDHKFVADLTVFGLRSQEQHAA